MGTLTALAALLLWGVTTGKVWIPGMYAWVNGITATCVLSVSAKQGTPDQLIFAMALAVFELGAILYLFNSQRVRNTYYAAHLAEIDTFPERGHLTPPELSCQNTRSTGGGENAA